MSPLSLCPMSCVTGLTRPMSPRRCLIFQQQQLLSRKSSASSTSSLEKPHHRLRHDEHSMKSVKDKIALFSTTSGGGGLHQSTEDVNSLHAVASVASTAAGSSNMTRAYTHSDVRYEQRSNGSRGANVVHRVSSGGGGSASATSIVEQRRPNVKSVSSADLTSHNRRVTTTHSSRTRPPSLSAAAGGAAGGRSQSLLEIGRAAVAPAHGLAPKRASLTGAGDVSDARQISLPPASSAQRLSLSTPPWKSGQQSRYSPAFKRKPFAVYSTGNVKPPSTTTAATAAGVPPLRRRNATATVDDSDTDSAVSSGRSSISHSSVSPPPAPGSSQQHENRRVLKKNSVEAINRRNVINSCKKSSGAGGVQELRELPEAETQSGPGIPSRSASITSLGKPASRSSSFTIAERKKSFESRNNGTTTNTTSSNGTDSRRGSIASTASSTATLDSALPRRSASRDAVFESGSTSSTTDSRRSSRDTIAGDVEEGVAVIGRSEGDGGSRVTTPTKQGSDRSCSVTPTGAAGGIAESSGGRRIVSRNNSITSDRSTYSNAETKNSYARSSSVVSKDSGLAEEDGNKWTLLEKKYSSNSNGNSLHSGDTKNKIAKFTMDPSPTERPKELSVKKNSLSSACSKTAATPSGASSIRELTERFESAATSAASSRRESVVSNASSVFDSSTCSASSVVATPTNNPAFRIGDKTFITSNWLEDKSPAMYLPEESTEWESFDPSTPFTPPLATRNVNNNSLKPAVPKDRKFSVPIYSEGKDEDDRSNEVKMRDKKNQNAAPSRPSSLIETSTLGAGELKVFEIGNLGERQNVILSNSTSRGSSQADLLTDAETSLINKGPLLLPQPSSSSASSSKPGSVTGIGVSNIGGNAGGAGGGVGSAGGAGTKPGSAGGSDASRRCVSVNDIRRAFEKAEASLSNSLKAASTW